MAPTGPTSSSQPTGTARPDPTSRQFFEDLYRADPDPWGFADDPYEQARYAMILDHLPAERVRLAFEPGCSVGVLTAELARRCDRVMAIDISERAVRAARARCAEFPGVEIQRGALPVWVPDEPVDLVVLCEVGYYFDEPVLADLAGSLAQLLAPGGRLVAEHWTGTSPDHVLHGRDVHRILRDNVPIVHRICTQYRHTHGSLDPDDPVNAEAHEFVLDVWDAP